MPERGREVQVSGQQRNIGNNPDFSALIRPKRALGMATDSHTWENPFIDSSKMGNCLCAQQWRFLLVA